ncbi:MAG: LysM peptidoglycan-binding domain-containing protein [Methylobacterium sp.]|uniref:LysM peptidoglycan-binding domain-containing protein n=1 Tax=Methylobacterium sp. TaxID=409 RepID=UPI002715CDD6|nr:LysM peptidoglycan-binding domain-containing protein [Methylobacterium sp.]MDO9429216.1 LysM peptidoglycan-binding domain-containing protein [Methylobacterium sp.]
MLTRLSRAFLRVFPAILLVVVGLLAALFRRRGGSRKGATTLVPVPARQTAPPVRRRGAAIALLALLIGIGLILALVGGDGALWRLGSPLPSSNGEGGRPVATLSRPDGYAGTGNTSETVAPGGSATKRTPGEPGAAMAPGPPDPNSPSFDTVRVETNGELVVAGRATPNGTVELLVDGKPTARAVADGNGQFAIVPPALPVGNSEVGLRATDAKGIVRQSRDSVAVAVAPSRDAKPLVALTSPDKATVVLSQPGSSRTVIRSVPDAVSARRTTSDAASPSRRGSGEVAPTYEASNAIGENDAVRSGRTGVGDGPDAKVSDRATSKGIGSRFSEAPQALPPERAVVTGSAEAPTKVVSVDAQEGGRLYVSGQAPAGATVRLYLNDTLIAPATVGRDGSVTFTIGRGVKPGDYRVRLDQVDATSGKVHSRVEVPFSVPHDARIAGTGRSVPAPPEASPGGQVASNASQPAAVGRQGANQGTSEGPRDSISSISATKPSSITMSDPLRPNAVPGAVYVPEVRTARIERGDSLWAISRRTYGEGDRYTAIYDANQDQIRDPDLIYPGQVFVLPAEDAIDAGLGEKRG